MNMAATLVALAIGFSVFTGLLYVLFGQITVRKLRKRPEARNALGVELVSGWDILNVAGALSRPRWLNERFKKSSMSAMAADAEVLNNATNTFDRILGRLFFLFFCISGGLGVLLALLAAFGVIE